MNSIAVSSTRFLDCVNPTDPKQTPVKFELLFSDKNINEQQFNQFKLDDTFGALKHFAFNNDQESIDILCNLTVRKDYIGHKANELLLELAQKSEPGSFREEQLKHSCKTFHQLCLKNENHGHKPLLTDLSTDMLRLLIDIKLNAEETDHVSNEVQFLMHLVNKKENPTAFPSSKIKLTDELMERNIQQSLKEVRTQSDANPQLPFGQGVQLQARLKLVEPPIAKPISALPSHIQPAQERDPQAIQLAETKLFDYQPELKGHIQILNTEINPGNCHKYALGCEFDDSQGNNVFDIISSKDVLYDEYLHLHDQDPNVKIAVFYQDDQIAHTARYNAQIDAYVHTFPNHALFSCEPETLKEINQYDKVEILSPDNANQYQAYLDEIAAQQKLADQERAARVNDENILDVIEKNLIYVQGLDVWELRDADKTEIDDFNGIDENKFKLVKILREVEKVAKEVHGNNYEFEGIKALFLSKIEQAGVDINLGHESNF
ncbi:hypothetical protein [uncultured Shewanella sp.]|uniref:hypothetical protein n=1 Tax=uncultured Shewanella sp. TaxID=173975 RepID=UPI0026323D79|nr:hypothetical protein [uncultured Shewanella sp.]